MSDVSNKNLYKYVNEDLDSASNDNVNENLDENLNKRLHDQVDKGLHSTVSEDLKSENLNDTESLTPDLSEKKKKKKKAKLELPAESSVENAVDGEVKAPLGTSKAVETMFRNALRTELDLIALAATKANIMISMNGIIISALMISGAFIFVSSVAFLIPAGMFMFTAAASIFFAILAASPEKAHYFTGFSKWLKALIKREAHFRDLHGFLARANRSSDGEVNLLINKDRMQLTREEYWERMQAMMRDRDETYHAMSDQLYWLGQIAARNGKMLNISYSIFRWGMLFSVLASIFLKALLFFYPAAASDVPPQLDASGMGTLVGVYEPSAVQQLPDGRVLVVEDEEQRAMNIMTVAPDGSLSENAVASLQLTRSFGRKLNDLEGLTADDKGFIYAVTSHSSDTSGKRDPNREQLIRFRVNGNIAGDISDMSTLREEIAKSPVINAAFQARLNTGINIDELDIEGLAYDNSTHSLMLGLRGPMAGKSSVIIPIINSDDIFTNKAAPVFGQPIFLDLNGGGIRSLYFDPVLGMFVIANEINDPAGNKEAQIWTWTGDPKDKPAKVETPELAALKNIEAVDSITANGTIKMIFMADEGDAKKGIHARYVLLDYKKFTQ
ncbi:DUF3616 domain-containing protein [Psychrobacter urativorans]|uniref:Cadherin domain-containing protein n=1 Tax=Psychrobacter urativorans TaxID=45610 RepID=A0A0M4TVP1_9GAMM|nr:DUF3616 domain-containing protein [Psychrobacter urativorans]ALF60011.1 hypothetical protein AOC03_08115 [Psychrobacter urativorans]